MSKHNNDYFKDEKIINDGKKKKRKMKLKYYALMISLSQTCQSNFHSYKFFKYALSRNP